VQRVVASRPVGELAGREVLDQLEGALKAEPPRGKLPALKVPDPEFLVGRLEDGKSAGLLSRRPRVQRVGDPQALVNEIGQVKGLDEAHVWAVVSQGGPVPVKDLGALDSKLRAGLDQFTLEEFSTEKGIFYLPLRLLVKFDPPLKLKRPPPGRRFASAIDFSRDLAKEAPDALAFADDPSVDVLQELDDDDVRALRHALRDLYDSEFRGNDATRARGVTREDVINAHAFVLDEFDRRGLPGPDNDEPFLRETLAFLAEAKAAGNANAARVESRFAVVHASGLAAHADDPIKIAEVLDAFAKPMALRMPCVFLVGGVANHGQSANDIDLLIRGPFDPDLEHIVKFRLGRALPPRLSQRAQFITGDVGPFTNHVPLYDLVLVPHEDRGVVQMSAAQKADDPLQDWPAKPGKRPYVLQLHFRGHSMHGDLRIAVDDKTLVGWTLAFQTASTVPDVNTLAQAREIARTFDVEGSRFIKPMQMPARIFATPKSRQPLVWLNLPDKVFPPGAVGSTREEQGVFVRVLKGTGAEWGLQKPFSHEYFFSGEKRFSGILFFRMLEGMRGPSGATEFDEEAAQQTFWTAGFTKSLLPGVLKRRAVQSKSMPPLGHSAMPTTLMQATPREFRFWEADSEKEARETRDALVKERIFTDTTIGLDGNAQFRLVERKVLSFPHDPADDEVVEKADSVPFSLTWQWWKGQTVVRAAPSRQVWHLNIADRGGKRVTDWQLQRDPLAGDEAIMAQPREGGAELLKFEGDAPPGTKVGGINLNPTKATPSAVRVQDKGKVELLDDQPSFKKLRFNGAKLRGIFTLVAEEVGGGVWQLSPGADPGRAVPKAKAIDDAEGHVHEIPGGGPTGASGGPDHKHALPGGMLTGAPMETSTGTHVHELPDGRLTGPGFMPTQKQARTRADGVQVWNPADVEDDDDKGGERAKLRPPALFRHMKPAGGSNTVFHDPGEAAEKFLLSDERLLRAGVQVEPKFNGFSAVAERWDAGVADDVHEGGVLVFTEDEQRPLQEQLAGFAAELKALGGNFVLDGEIMGIDDDGNFLPRRDLAQFRGTGDIEDSHLRYMVFDTLYLPSHGNVTQKPMAERRRLLERWWSQAVGRKKGRLLLAPKRVARTRAQLRAAIDWAAEQPGSEGAMLKQVDATYSLGGENDLFGKVKLVREVRALVIERHSVSGSPGVYNFYCAVGPIPANEADKWKEPVQHGGKTWVRIGRTGNKKLAAKVGDVINVEVLEVMWEEGPPTRIRWFGPAQALDVAKGRPTTTKELRSMLRPEEVKKADGAVRGDGLILAPRSMAEAVADGSKTLVVKTKPFADLQGDEFILLSERLAFGVVQLGAMEELSVADFERRQAEHLITPKLRAEWCEKQESWCQGPFFAWPVKVLERFEPPLPTNAPVGPQVLVHDVVVSPSATKSERSVRVLKADSKADTGGKKEERFVFGVVLVPNEVDAQGEIYSPDEVRKAAHSFMELFGGQLKLMHKGRPVDGVLVLETYLTKQKEAHGGETFPEGTWLLAVRVQDDALWKDVKSGAFTGFSIGGTALRERLQ
jgi:hypothetical protein